MAEATRSDWWHYIDGQWTEGAGGGRIDIENPATGEVFATITRATAADVDSAVDAARRCVAARSVRDMRPAARGRMLIDVADALRGRADEIARLLVRDSGKPLSQAQGEVEGSARYFEYYGGQADKLEGRYIPLGSGWVDYTVPEPHGVSAQIIPWNYPLEMPARSIAPAFAAGNAVVVKSPELDPLAAAVLAEICDDVGFPKGSINVICGYGDEAGEALVAHRGIDQIVFTGSIETGQRILHKAADRVIPCVMELGGKSAGIVYPDADIEQVIGSTRWGIFLNSGQACNAMSRLLVHPSRHDDVLHHIDAMVKGLRIGPGIEDNEITPLISAAQLERVEGMCRRAVDDGGVAALGGRRVERPGYYMAPTVFSGINPAMHIAQNEVFGPVLSIMRADSPEEALQVANDTKYGLAAGVFTRDLDLALWTAERLQAGQVYINEWYAGGVETPFGGVKQSGYGREKGQEAIWNYVQSKNVGIRLNPGRLGALS